MHFIGNGCFRFRKVLIGTSLLLGTYLTYLSLPISRTLPYDDVVNGKWIFGEKDAGIRLVTATSSNHFKEALRSCQNVATRPEAKLWKRGFMILYDLGDISPSQKQLYMKQCPFVEWRNFNFSKYPTYVKSLTEYRWKPILVNEVLQETSKIFYFDSSVLISSKPEYSFEKIFNEMKTNFSTCGFRLYDRTHHTLFSATHPSMFTYYNFSISEAKATEMYGATLFTLIRNDVSVKLMQNLANCALDKSCMAPEGHRVNCISQALRSNRYANCHRYDQAALAILLAQCSRNQSDYVGPTEFFSVSRM